MAGRSFKSRVVSSLVTTYDRLMPEKTSLQLAEECGAIAVGEKILFADIAQLDHFVEKSRDKRPPPVAAEHDSTDYHGSGLPV